MGNWIKTPFGGKMPGFDQIIREAEAECAPIWDRFAQVEQRCFERVLRCMQSERVAARHFAPTTGYGYGDVGRDTLERVYAKVFGAERALVRPHILSGTHALSIALFGLLRPGETLLSAAGKPYDTLDPVIGITDAADGSLASFGIAYRQVDLREDGSADRCGVIDQVDQNTGVVLIQRSRGYALRPPLTMEEIEALCAFVHKKNQNTYVLVDNCYGEFVCEKEPTMVGADVAVGSLIKNPGGGLAPTGAYIIGTDAALQRIESRLTAPGVGAEIGSYEASYRPFYQGLFMASHAVCQALKGAALAARVFEKAGYQTYPSFDEPRNDIIQAIQLDEPEKLTKFCRAVQSVSPVDSFLFPEPWEMPGYAQQVIMAAGTFVAGASIELSADAPMRPPYAVYWQGGLTYAHCKTAVKACLEAMFAI